MNPRTVSISFLGIGDTKGNRQIGVHISMNFVDVSQDIELLNEKLSVLPYSGEAPSESSLVDMRSEEELRFEDRSENVEHAW
jgi:hypothetical protein